MAGGWFDAGTLSTVFTGDATVNDFADPLDGGSWMAEVDFGPGTSDASDTSTANRMLRIAFVGPPNGSTASAHWTGTSQAQFAFGRDWMAETTAAGRVLTVQLPVYETANGPTNSDMYFVVKNGSTVIATSPYFDGYNATSQWKTVEADIPASVLSFEGGVSLEVRFRANTAAQNAKTAYFSAHGAVVDKTIATGQQIYAFAQGGASVDNYNDTGWWSDEAMSLLAEIDPETISICLGLNDSSGGDATTFAAEIATFTGRLRTYCPNAKIVLTSPHARLSYGASYGGGGPTPYYAAGMLLAQRQVADSLCVDMSRLLPNAGILSGLYWNDFSNIANGQWVYKGMVVEDAGNVYAAKTDHAKTATVPGSDGTNWQLVAATGTRGVNQPRGMWLNPVLSDGLHPHMPGNFVWMQTWRVGLEAAGALQDAEYYAAKVREELTAELAHIDADISTAISVAGDIITETDNIDTTLGTLATAVADVPTVAEFDARTLVAAAYGTASAQSTILADSGAIKGVTDALSPRLPGSGTLSILDASAVTTAATASLNSYDPPTKAELDARTLAAADYFDAAGDEVTVGAVKSQALTAKAGENLQIFFDNAGGTTEQLVDDVGTGGGGGGEADWTTTEKQQLRYRFGIDGTTNTPSATPNLGSVTVGTNNDKTGYALTTPPLDATATQTAAQAGAAAALNSYDPPTNAELTARTKPTADYFDPASDSVTVGTNSDKTGYALTTAPPTVAAIRQEMDDNSTKLGTIDTNAATAATQSTAAATRVATALPNAIPGASTGLARVTDLPEGGGSGGTIIPVNQVPVPAARTWTLIPKPDGLVGDRRITMRLTDDAKTFAVDYYKDLSTNGRLEDYVSVTAGEGIEISEAEADLGVDKSQLKFKVTPLVAGTYYITTIAEYGAGDGGGESTGLVVLVVLP